MAQSTSAPRPARAPGHPRPRPASLRRRRRALQAQIQRTIDRLGLNDATFRRDRTEDAELYWSRDVSLLVLKQESPFVAEELRRQGRLNPGDT
jgi:hypothetical protein